MSRYCMTQNHSGMHNFAALDPVNVWWSPWGERRISSCNENMMFLGSKSHSVNFYQPRGQTLLSVPLAKGGYQNVVFTGSAIREYCMYQNRVLRSTRLQYTGCCEVHLLWASLVGVAMASNHGFSCIPPWFSPSTTELRRKELIVALT